MGNYYNPVHTYFGKGEIKNLSNIIKSLENKVERVLLLTRGGTFSDSVKYKEIMEQLAQLKVYEYEFNMSNPDIEDLYSLINSTEDYNYDMVLAVGGGSVLDMGKAIASFKGIPADNPSCLRKIIIDKSYITNRAACRWIAVPTTSGTGSEVTPWATIWDREKGVKYSIDDKSLFAYGAIIDPEFTLGLPVRTTVSTALDALCHATEAYWSKYSNELSRIYALNAIQNIVGYLEKLIEEPNNILYREKIAFGSFYAGLAFSNTRTTACHSISYPLTLMFGIDHGIATCLTLAKIMKNNENAIYEKDNLFKAFGTQNCEEVEEIIDKLLLKAGCSSRLQDYNIDQDDLIRIVEKAYTKGRMDNNPVDITEESLFLILKSIYNKSA